MNSLPKLKLEGLSQPEADDSIASPVTPATAENETGATGNGFGNKRRRIGGLPISMLVNEKDDDTPVSYPLEYQPPLPIKPMTPASPKLPPILYQMSEFVTQLGERAVEGPLPSFKSLGLPTIEHPTAAAESKNSTDASQSQSKASTAKPDEIEAPGHDETVASDSGKDTACTEPEREPKAPRRKRTRAERDMPITTEPEIESLIKTLREKEQSQSGEVKQRGEAESSEPQAQEENKAQAQTAGTTTANSLSLGVSKSAKVTKPRKNRRGRPNGDDRPRLHACPTCQRRFHQQSGVANHYRIVHFKDK